jgi:hypothetical protein
MGYIGSDMDAMLAKAGYGAWCFVVICVYNFFFQVAL